MLTALNTKWEMQLSSSLLSQWLSLSIAVVAVRFGCAGCVLEVDELIGPILELLHIACFLRSKPGQV